MPIRKPIQVPLWRSATSLVQCRSSGRSVPTNKRRRVGDALSHTVGGRDDGKWIPGGGIDETIEGKGRAVSDRTRLEMTDRGALDAAPNENSPRARHDVDIEMGVGKQPRQSLDEQPEIRHIGNLQLMARSRPDLAQRLAGVGRTADRASPLRLTRCHGIR